jgi:hypothetical protein
LAAEVLAAFIFVGLPLLVASASVLTRLRSSRRKQVVIWVAAAALSIATLLPFIVVWLGWSTTTFEEHRFVVGE